LLESYGWSHELQAQFDVVTGPSGQRPARPPRRDRRLSRRADQSGSRALVPARVTVQQRGLYTLASTLGELAGALSGRFAFEAGHGDNPVAGDWVAVAARPDEGAATIHAVLPRRTAFVRRAAGTGVTEQVVAANVDTAFLVTSLNADFNLRRIERYLVTAWESGAQPVIVLTKADLCDEVEELVFEVESIAFGVPVHAVSAVTGRGLDELRGHLGPGRTAVLLGSSGVGKSTLVNALAGVELLATAAIREDDGRGRHTTTHRELILLPDGGGLVLDTPGMRELGLWDASEGVGGTFGDVEELFADCRFSDCAHEAEPGCAVRAALAEGTLDAARWESYVKLQRELAHLERKGDPRSMSAERKKWIARSKAHRTTVW
jgi:ribosome biogenesis GTPase / thiamine phosphate phosphatase